MIKHLAFSKTGTGKQILKEHNISSEDLINHFCKINNCQKKDFEEHYDKEHKVFIKRSKQDNWKQNFGEYSYLINNPLPKK